MTEFVRVKLENKAEASITPALAKLAEVTVLDKKPAADANGVALPAKYPTARSRPATAPAADNEEK